MPYVKRTDRALMKPQIDYLLLFLNEKGYNPGWINYIITTIIYYWWKSSAQNYATLALICGTLDNVKDEFYRRVASPYEDRKIEEHGDVFSA